ncbi:MAG: NDP-sugar synthase [Actinomycetota bacterium]|nr:NDP-sugar synthase [Actinomycetota bacterium]MDD5666686.1 NDP-sugar synthase [Actinomycetota bacterium]
MQAVILVGGQGTRLRPLTLTVPKPMLPLMNRPFLEFQIDLCRRHGIKDIVLSTAYKPEVFEEYFGDGSRLGVKLTCVTEDEPLDTCGAVKNVERHISGTFLVFNGDVLTNLDIASLIAFHREKGGKATLYLTRVEDPTAYGLVPLDRRGRIAEFLEKPSWDQVITDLINAGTYVLEPELLDRVPDGECFSFERQLFPGLLDDGIPMYGFPSDAYWMDIGTPAKYLQAHYDILARMMPFDFSGEMIKPSVWAEEGAEVSPEAAVFGPTVIGPGCHIAPHATVSSNCVLGPGCEVGEGAHLEGAVLHEGCRVGAESVLRQCVLASGVRVGENVHVSDQAVLGGGVTVEDGNDLKHGIKVWPRAKIPPSTLHF